MNDQSNLRGIRLAASDQDLDFTKQYAGTIIALGVFLIVLGALAVSASSIATLATVVVFGILLLTGSAVQFMSASLGKGTANFVLPLAAGILYLVTGILMIARPVQAAAGLTLALVAFFLVAGLLRIVMAIAERSSGWGWTLFQGAVNLLLGSILWYGWPWSSLWFLGLFVGIEMIIGGFFWLNLGYTVRRLVR